MMNGLKIVFRGYCKLKAKVLNWQRQVTDYVISNHQRKQIARYAISSNFKSTSEQKQQTGFTSLDMIASIIISSNRICEVSKFWHDVKVPVFNSLIPLKQLDLKQHYLQYTFFNSKLKSRLFSYEKMMCWELNNSKCIHGNKNQTKISI